jgi:WD40 repeat protein
VGAYGRAAFSADGRWLALPAKSEQGHIADVAVQLWDCAAGARVRAFGKAPYCAVQFSPDGKTLAALRYDSVVETWDPHAGRLLRRWQAGEGKAMDLAFEPRFAAGGKLLLTSHHGKAVRCWDAATGDRLWEVTGVLTSTAWAAAPAGNLLAVDGTDYQKKTPAGETPEARLRLIDVSSGKELRQLVARQEKNPLGQPWWFLSAEFSADGRLLATTGHDRLIRLWDTATGKELRSWSFAPNRPGAMAFAPDGRTLAVADAGTAVRLLNVAGGEAALPPGLDSGFFRPAFSPDGRTALTLGTVDGNLHCWDPNTGRLLRRHEWPALQAALTVLAPDGRAVFAWGTDQPVRTWDAATGKEVRSWPDHRVRYPQGMVPSPDGKLLALLLQSPTMVVVDAATGKEVRRLDGHSPWPYGAAFAPDGRTLVSWGGDARAVVWDLSTGRQLRQIIFTDKPDPLGPKAPGPVVAGGGLTFYATAVSPDCRWIAFGSRNGFIAVHDLGTGREVRRLDPLPEGVSGMAFAPDGRTLAWYGGEVIRLVELASGRERQRFAGHRGSVTALAFSPDGRRLLSGSQDTTALVWDLMGRHDARPAALAADELEACWADLAGDAARAWQAVHKLVAAPEAAVPFLRARLRPVPAADDKKIARLIDELGSDRFAVRDSAAAGLEKRGEAAVGACRKALDAGPSAEVRRRLTALLEKVALDQWRLSPEARRAVRAVEALERMGTAEAKQLLETLARGAPDARLTREAVESLQRLRRAAADNSVVP